MFFREAMMTADRASNVSLSYRVHKLLMTDPASRVLVGDYMDAQNYYRYFKNRVLGCYFWPTAI
jgi:hypothetical protein